jgi:hypothetical protein
MEVTCQLHAPGVLPSGKEPRYPLDTRLGGPQRRSGRCGEEKNSKSVTGLEPPISNEKRVHWIYFYKYIQNNLHTLSHGYAMLEYTSSSYGGNKKFLYNSGG